MTASLGRFAVPAGFARQDRPYIVCHMLTALDGRISGPAMDTEEACAAGADYETVNRFYAPGAWVNGRKTAAEHFTSLAAPAFAADAHARAEALADHIALRRPENCLVVLDPAGRLGWEKNFVQYAGRPKAHIVIALSEQADPRHAAYLRDLGISVLVCGKRDIDCGLLARKLRQCFGIRVLKVSGGGQVNWSFAREGLIDELSLVAAPVADGLPGAPSLFDRRRGLSPNEPCAAAAGSETVMDGPVRFALKETRILPGGSVWLRYARKGAGSGTGPEELSAAAGQGAAGGEERA
ncbi:MAG: dihydrofolate reductase family protein [Desulfovibrionaceae bacterium]|nr:dihydrofolate reductase family protein [Desulfovibrionaceae bacterium]